MSAWSTGQNVVIRELRHKGVQAVHEEILDRYGVEHTLHAIETQACRIHASLKVLDECPECHALGVRINRQSGMCRRCTEEAHVAEEEAFNQLLEVEAAGCDGRPEYDELHRRWAQLRQRNSRLMCTLVRMRPNVHEGNELEPAGIAPVNDTGCAFPTFGIVRPAVTNTRVEMSTFGQSVFADAVDVVQAVDLTYDALINEVDVSKMRVFLSDVLFDRDKTGDEVISIPFGKADCTVFRKVMSTEDFVHEFALRTGSQVEAFRIALQMLGDLCGFGISYFDLEESRGSSRQLRRYRRTTRH